MTAANIAAGNGILIDNDQITDGNITFNVDGTGDSANIAVLAADDAATTQGKIQAVLGANAVVTVIGSAIQIVSADTSTSGSVAIGTVNAGTAVNIGTVARELDDSDLAAEIGTPGAVDSVSEVTAGGADGIFTLQGTPTGAGAELTITRCCFT